VYHDQSVVLGRYLTSKDVQEMLYLSRTRIEQLRREDATFPAAFQPGGPGGQLLFLTADVIAWAESRRSPVAPSKKWETREVAAKLTRQAAANNPTDNKESQ
jgi:Helix-turn-helix domain